jgi:hypothetical protein
VHSLNLDLMMNGICVFYHSDVSSWTIPRICRELLLASSIMLLCSPGGFDAFVIFPDQ